MNDELMYHVTLSSAYGHPPAGYYVRAASTGEASEIAVQRYGKQTGLESRDIRAIAILYSDIDTR